MGSVPCELRSFDFKEAAGELCSRCVKLYATDNGRAKMTALRRFLRDETRLIGASSRWNNLDINAEGQTKGSAVQMLADYYGIRRDEICVIGDHDNDVEMMKQAGLSIAMGNASEACRAAADLLTASNRTAGVGRAIRQFLLP